MKFFGGDYRAKRFGKNSGIVGIIIYQQKASVQHKF